MLSGFSSRLTGSSLLLLGLCKVAVSFLKSSGNATPGMSRPTSHVRPTGCTCNKDGTVVSMFAEYFCGLDGANNGAYNKSPS